MRLKLDENLSRHLKPALIELGHDVLFRPVSLGPLSVNRFVERFARDTDLPGLSGCVAAVEPQGIRVRRPE